VALQLPVGPASRLGSSSKAAGLRLNACDVIAVGLDDLAGRRPDSGPSMVTRRVLLYLGKCMLRIESESWRVCGAGDIEISDGAALRGAPMSAGAAGYGYQGADAFVLTSRAGDRGPRSS